MDEGLAIYIIFNSISVISGRWAGDNERMCAMEPLLRLRRFRLEGARTRDARSLGQRLTHSAKTKTDILNARNKIIKKKQAEFANSEYPDEATHHGLIFFEFLI